MKFVLFAILVLFVFNGYCHAQAKHEMLTGVILLNNRDSVPYKIVFTETNGEIKGYSLTYNQPYETKTKITGTLDRSAYTLAFKETEIVYINGYHSGPSMCLIDAMLYEKQNGQGRLLKGSITSNESDNTSCAGGKIIFNNEPEIQDLFSYHEKYDTVISMKSRKKETNVIKDAPGAPALPLVTDKITTGQEKTYDWHTDTVMIDLWDGGNIDGDRVTVRFNDSIYLSGYSLVKEKKQLRIPLSGHSTDKIVIHADNEGTDPPNTASLLLADGLNKYSVLAYNKKGREAVIILKRIKSK